MLKNIAIALAFFISGKIGLLFVAPPAIATMIWPASGIALVGVLIWGRGVVFGIVLGSLLVNYYINFQYTGQVDLIGYAPVAIFIAIGSGLQALCAAYLARRFCGFPNIFQSTRTIILFILLCGPIACCISASFGNAALFFNGIIPITAIQNSWVAWWVGDCVGVILLTPILYIIFDRLDSKTQNNETIKLAKKSNYILKCFAVFLLIIPLYVTHSAWQRNKTTIDEFKRAEFLNLSNYSRENLQARLKSYDVALKSGVSLFASNGDKMVTRQQWRDYSTVMDFPNNFKGLNGVAYVAQVPWQKIDSFVAQQVESGIAEFRIKPEILAENFIVTYIEPIEYGRAALGLNLAFETNRRNAAIEARDSGLPAISKPILLVQDKQKNACVFVIFADV